jgi:hypothetical protein
MPVAKLSSSLLITNARLGRLQLDITLTKINIGPSRPAIERRIQTGLTLPE